jgi:hypothetical protein
MPLVLLGGYAMSKIRPKQLVVSRKTKSDPYDESNALLSDVIMNYRTIMSFGNKNIESIFQKYQNMLEGPKDDNNRQNRLIGLAYGYSLAIRILYSALIFYFGALVVENTDVK